MKNTDNHNVFFILQIEYAVVFAWQITILSVYRYQGIKRPSSARK